MALLGNGRPTVHGSLLEIGGGMPTGCKCAVGSGSAGKISAANGSATIPRTSSKDNAFQDNLSPPPLRSDRPTTTVACSPPSTTSSKSTPSRLSRNRRVTLCERHKETAAVTCSSPNNEDDSSIELYVCSHGNGHSHNNHHHHHHQLRSTNSDRCRAPMSSNPQSPDVYSSSVDDSGTGGNGGGANEYPILLHSFPHHLFPHCYSSRLNGHGNGKLD